jgi:hypothetical protein
VYLKKNLILNRYLRLRLKLEKYTKIIKNKIIIEGVLEVGILYVAIAPGRAAPYNRFILWRRDTIYSICGNSRCRRRYGKICPGGSGTYQRPPERCKNRNHRSYFEDKSQGI